MKTAMLCVLTAVLVGVPGAGAAQDGGGTQPPKGLAARVTALESVVAQQANAIAALQSALDSERAARQAMTFDLQRNDVGEGSARLALSDEVDLILVTLFQQGIAIPTFEQAQIASRESEAIASLLIIGSAQNVFFENFADYATSLSELSQMGQIISGQLATGTRTRHLLVRCRAVAQQLAAAAHCEERDADAAERIADGVLVAAIEEELVTTLRHAMDELRRFSTPAGALGEQWLSEQERRLREDAGGPAEAGR